MSYDENPGNASLSGPNGGPVIFDFNPATIVISHSVVGHPSAGTAKQQGTEQQGSGGTSPAQPSVVLKGVDAMNAAAGITTIAVRGVTFAGIDVKDTCELLHTWTVLSKAYASDGYKEDLPPLTFHWGSQNYTVTLNQLTINYNRFTPDGYPVRALVDMTFNLKPQYLSPTNPTSGGPPGRRSHVLTGAETLAGLSTQVYGNPGAWRQIATANGIQDPLRVPPGTLLYLPSAEENER
jgi:nucleoid-associated protein YgaU